MNRPKLGDNLDGGTGAYCVNKRCEIYSPLCFLCIAWHAYVTLLEAYNLDENGKPIKWDKIK